MAFEDLKERFVNDARALWEKIQDSSLFINAKEKYENLTPNMQKVTLAGVAVIATYLVVSVPWDYFSASSDSVEIFEERRQLIRDMMKVSRDAQDAPNIPIPPDMNSLKAQVDSQIQIARLLPEQIRSTEIASERVQLIPGALVQGVLNISLLQLNLRQVIDLGFQFQSISPSVKMTDLQMVASEKDPRYYDVTYKLAVLNVPEAPAPPAEEPPPPPKRKGSK